MRRRRPFVAPVGDDVALSAAALGVLAERRAALGHALDSPDTLERELADITRRADANLAVAVLDAWLRAHPVHGPFIRRVETAPIDAAPIGSNGPDRPTLIVVPGMFHREYPELGADGRLIRDIARRFGLHSELAPTEGLGSVADNAVRLHRYLGEREPSRFWLVSLSRGSADVRRLLGERTGAPYLEHLEHWVSVCGIVAGSPLHARPHRSRLGTFLFGLAVRGLGGSRALGGELQREHPSWRTPDPPSGPTTTHVVALPSSWDVGTPVVRRYRALARHGPTDGVVMLSDYCRRPGRIYPIRGADHLLRTSTLAGHLYRLFHRLGAEQ